MSFQVDSSKKGSFTFPPPPESMLRNPNSSEIVSSSLASPTDEPKQKIEKLTKNIFLVSMPVTNDSKKQAHELKKAISSSPMYQKCCSSLNDAIPNHSDPANDSSSSSSNSRSPRNVDRCFSDSKLPQSKSVGMSSPIPIRHSDVANSSDSESPRSIQSPRQGMLSLVMGILKSPRSNDNSQKSFGSSSTSLSMLSPRQQLLLPSQVISNTIAFLKKEEGEKVEGIFRKSESLEIENLLYAKITSGKKIPEGSSLLAIASVLKKLYKEYPFPDELKDLLSSTQVLQGESSSSVDFSREIFLDGINKSCDDKWLVFKEMMFFLVEISQNVAFNKMDENNLSKIFAPIIFRSYIDSIDDRTYAQQISTIIDTCKDLLSYYTVIYKSAQKTVASPRETS